MKKIHKVEVEGESIYLHKSKYWKVIYPVKNEDGSFNWPNLWKGTKANLGFVTFILFLMGCFFLAYYEQSHNLTILIDRVKEVCPLVFQKVNTSSLNLNLTYSP